LTFNEHFIALQIEQRANFPRSAACAAPAQQIGCHAMLASLNLAAPLFTHQSDSGSNVIRMLLLYTQKINDLWSAEPVNLTWTQTRLKFYDGALDKRGSFFSSKMLIYQN